MTALRVVRSGPLEPIENMALDEALLASGGPPVLRLYGWRPVAVSIGRFQRLADFDGARFGPVVRRATGGGAIHHEQEITFAIVCDAGLLPSDLGAGYALVHDAIGRALSGFGVAARRHGRGALSPRPQQLWCFDEPTCFDLVTARGKIVGSAQRRTRRPRPRVLHHGSIVLRPPAATPRCGAVADFVEPEPIAADLEHAVAAELAHALSLRAEATPLEVAPTALEAARRVVRERLAAR